MGISRLSRVLISLVLVFVLVAALACESDDPDEAAEETPAASTAQTTPTDATTTTSTMGSDSSSAMDSDKSDSTMMPHDNDGLDSRMSNEDEFAMAMEFLKMFGSMAEVDKQPKADIEMKATGVIGDAQDAGIWVNGVGSVSAPPDLVELNLGVTATADPVSEARQSAAEAMTAVIGYLVGSGVAMSDIRTQHISIQPQYDWQERIEEGIRRSERVLTGYQVSNTVQVLVREMDRTSELLDGAVVAGGDLIRVNGITFTIEDTSALEKQAREMAVADALVRAAELASYSGVILGPLVFLSEVSAQPVFAERAFVSVVADSSVSTPISPGEQEVRITVRAVFDIDNRS